MKTLLKLHNNNKSSLTNRYREVLMQNNIKLFLGIRTQLQNCGLNCFNILFCTAEEVKKKFNSLRTYYNKELKKVQSSKKSGTGTGELYISGWIYYDAFVVFL